MQISITSARNAMAVDDCIGRRLPPKIVSPQTFTARCGRAALGPSTGARNHTGQRDSKQCQLSDCLLPAPARCCRIIDSMQPIYLDSNSTAPLLPEVAQALADAYEAGYANPASQHALGRRAHQVLEDTREEIARLLGANPSDQLLFTSGGTEANNLALFGLTRSSLAARPIEPPRPHHHLHHRTPQRHGRRRCTGAPRLANRQTNRRPQRRRAVRPSRRTTSLRSAAESSSASCSQTTKPACSNQSPKSSAAQMPPASPSTPMPARPSARSPSISAPSASRP